MKRLMTENWLVLDLEQFFIDKAEEEESEASHHWKRGDYTARADVEGQRACQRASGLYQSAEAYGG
jgi:hypothetical protein